MPIGTVGIRWIVHREASPGLVWEWHLISAQTLLDPMDSGENNLALVCDVGYFSLLGNSKGDEPIQGKYSDST